ncbi:MAG: proton-conducting transporter membrane subunit, partial [Wohlfahrtiimonas sp.]
ISHGFVSAAMFLSIGVLYDRVHSREIADYGGVINRMPIFGAFFIFFAMANSGLPGTSGFIGEFWVLLASFHYGIYITIAVATSLILSAAYNLWLTKRVILGEAVHQHVKELKDINSREYFLLAILAIFIVLLGVWPAPLANVMQASIDHLLANITIIGQP